MAFTLDASRDLSPQILRAAAAHGDAALLRILEVRRSQRSRVHLARISVKKMRAYLRLLGDPVSGRIRREEARLKAMVRPFSALRDAAAGSTFFADALRSAGGPVAPERAAVRRALASARAALSRRSATTEAALRDLARRWRSLNRRLRLDPPAASAETVRKAFVRDYGRTRQAFHRARQAPSAKRFHTWRKAVKAHAAQDRLLAGLRPSRVRKTGKELRHLGDLLGDHHDGHVLEKTLRRWRREGLVSGKAARAARTVIARRQDELAAEALALGESLFAEKKRVWRRRIKAGWKTCAP